MARGDIEEGSVFNLSFLDVFACTAGVLIFIVILQIFNIDLMIDRSEYDKILHQLQQTQAKLQETEQRLEEAMEEKSRLARELEETRNELELTLARLLETEEKLAAAREEKSRLARELQETLQELEIKTARLRETQRELERALAEKTRLAEELDRKIAELQATRQELARTREEKEKLAGELDFIRGLREIQVAVTSHRGGYAEDLSGGEPYAIGEKVRLRADPEDGYEFERWTGFTELITEGRPESREIVVTIDGREPSFTATFRPKRYSLNLDAIPSGYGTAEDRMGGEYYEGERTIVSAIAYTGFRFVEWRGDTEHISDPESSDVLVTMPARDITLRAVFRPR